LKLLFSSKLYAKKLCFHWFRAKGASQKNFQKLFNAQRSFRTYVLKIDEWKLWDKSMRTINVRDIFEIIIIIQIVCKKIVLPLIFWPCWKILNSGGKCHKNDGEMNSKIFPRVKNALQILNIFFWFLGQHQEQTPSFEDADLG